MEKNDNVAAHGPTERPLRTQCGYTGGAVLHLQQCHRGEYGEIPIKFGGKSHSEGIAQVSLSHYQVMASLTAHGTTVPTLRIQYGYVGGAVLQCHHHQNCLALFVGINTNEKFTVPSKETLYHKEWIRRNIAKDLEVLN